MKRITVLGNFSGRNAGDNAILGNLMDDLGPVFPDVEFVVPTLNAGYVERTFSRHKVKAVGLMPWNLSLKIFGLPTLLAMTRTDLVLVTDNILFEKQFFNPVFNYLSTLSLIAPLCKRRNIPVVLYNASLGPIHSARGARALQRVLDAGPLAILRDQGSVSHLKDLGINPPRLIEGADCALNTQSVSDQRVDEIMEVLNIGKSGRPLLGFNINSYIDSWQKGGEKIDRSQFISTLAGALDKVVENLGVDLVFIVSQVMDGAILDQLRVACKCSFSIRTIANPVYGYEEIASCMSRMGLVVAMRTHCLILSAAVGTPFVNINAYPKSENFVETLDMGDWTIQLNEVTSDTLAELISKAWNEQDQTRLSLRPAVEREQAKAHGAVAQIQAMNIL